MAIQLLLMIYYRMDTFELEAGIGLDALVGAGLVGGMGLLDTGVVATECLLSFGAEDVGGGTLTGGDEKVAAAGRLTSGVVVGDTGTEGDCGMSSVDLYLGSGTSTLSCGGRRRDAYGCGVAAVAVGGTGRGGRLATGDIGVTVALWVAEGRRGVAGRAVLAFTSANFTFIPPLEATSSRLVKISSNAGRSSGS
jgi:hypothetical protein